MCLSHNIYNREIFKKYVYIYARVSNVLSMNISFHDHIRREMKPSQARNLQLFRAKCDIFIVQKWWLNNNSRHRSIESL